MRWFDRLTTLAATGATIAEIAVALGCTERTVQELRWRLGVRMPRGCGGSG